MPTGARVSKYLKLPLALLAALAMLLLWSGPAGAETFGEVVEETGTAISEELPVLVPPPAEEVAPPAGGAASPVPEIVEAPETNSPVTDAPIVGGVPDVGGVPIVGGALEGTDGTGDDGAETPSEDPFDPAALAEGCEAALAEAGLPGGDTCAAIVACFTLLPSPTDSLPLDDAALEDLLMNGTPEEIEALLGEVFDPAAIPAFLACLGDALNLPVPGGEETPAPAPAPVVQPTVAPETYYENCDDARARGAAPVHAGQPGYRAGLDSDADGIGCEDAEGTIQTVAAGSPSTTTGKLAYTGFELTSALATGAALLALGGTVLLAARRRS